MRGTRDVVNIIWECRRITPAHAGNTKCLKEKLRVKRDHPRACGEHTSIFSASKCCLGSPPRMRGTLDILVANIDRFRITPAHAGNTLRRPDFLCHKQDHPRACGEHDSVFIEDESDFGSPPRMRGTRSRRRCAAPFRRITPAHAGNTRAGSRCGF